MTGPGASDPLPPWSEQVSAPGPDPESTSVQAKIVLVAVCAVAGAVLAIAAAWIWVAVADPPSAQLTAEGVFFGVAELDQESGVTFWFMVVTLAFGVVSGLVVAWRGYRFGVVTVVAVLVLSVIASVLTYWVGHLVFGADVQAQLETAEVGDTITSEVTLGTKVAYLAWPVGGLIGVLAAVFAWPKHQNRPEVAPPSSNLGQQSSS